MRTETANKWLTRWLTTMCVLVVAGVIGVIGLAATRSPGPVLLGLAVGAVIVTPVLYLAWKADR